MMRPGIFSRLPLFIFCVGVVAAAGCSKPVGFYVKNLAKTDIDLVSEIHFNTVADHLKILTEKLYKRNPAELMKGSGETIKTRTDKIFQCSPVQRHSEVEMLTGTDAILLGFDPNFQGDRVFAMMYGLYTMILASYNNKCAFYFPDQLSEVKLYHSARNVEIFVWRLKNRRKDNGDLFILTNSVDGPVQNLSCERLFGKVIALQDSMALIVAGRLGRVLSEFVRVAAGMVFFPIPL